MFRVINEYLNKITLKSDNEIFEKISEAVKGIKEVQKYTVTVNFNSYVVDIKMKKYTVQGASRVFEALTGTVAYPYSSLHVRYNEGSCVRYRFVTCKENKEGIYCDIVIS